MTTEFVKADQEMQASGTHGRPGLRRQVLRRQALDCAMDQNLSCGFVSSERRQILSQAKSEFVTKAKGQLEAGISEAIIKFERESHGRTLIKQVRMELLEKARPLLNVIVGDITGHGVRSLHTDISTVTGERIIVFSLAGPLPPHSRGVTVA